MPKPDPVLLLALLPLPALAQEVAPCDPPPPVTALIEPWEETAATLAEGAVRLAVIEGEEGTRRLLVLTLPPPDPEADPGAQEGAAPPARACRIVAEGGLGFADLDLGGLEAQEDEAAGTLALRVPALGFVPESSELRPETLVLTLTPATGGLEAAIEQEEAEGAEAP